MQTFKITLYVIIIVLARMISYSYFMDQKHQRQTLNDEPSNISVNILTKINSNLLSHVMNEAQNIFRIIFKLNFMKIESLSVNCIFHKIMQQKSINLIELKLSITEYSQYFFFCFVLSSASSIASIQLRLEQKKKKVE